MAPSPPTETRTIGLTQAVVVGVGAIVGGGILGLAGPAFELAGPSALLAIALNGGVALLTALCFAEMATAFPISGGAYAFARRVLDVRAAFAVGWVLWFAYIAAGVLYAIGFGAFAAAALDLPASAVGRPLALAAIVAYTALFMRVRGGGGKWETIGKMVVFAAVVAVGLASMPGRASSGDLTSLRPFVAGGGAGLAGAMGVSFIALQGFDAIATMAGEVKDPRRTLPRAMVGSLLIALAVYIPLLLIVATHGPTDGADVQHFAGLAPDTVVPRAVERFMGRTGWWLVVVAALLAMMSALAANVAAASRVAASMAADRALPPRLAATHPESGAPRNAVLASGGAMALLLLVVSDLAAAGSAASLVFLLSFLLANLTALLARLRGGGGRPDAYRTPLFPLVPALGILSCTLLAGYQLGHDPRGATLSLAWLGMGLLLFESLFGRRAASFDARAEAQDPDLARLRGRTPLVLVPVANPANAPGLVSLAAAISPPAVGRVLLLLVVRPGGPDGPSEDELDRLQLLVRRAVGRAAADRRTDGPTPETLVTVAPEPWPEIRRVADDHQCTSLVLGLSDLSDAARIARLESLLASIDCDVVLLRAPDGWDPARARSILIPTGGNGGHDELRAQLLGSLARDTSRDVTFLRVLPRSASDRRVAEAKVQVGHFAADEAPGAGGEVARSDELIHEIASRAERSDLLVLGMGRGADGRRRIGRFALDIAARTDTPILLIGRRGRATVGND